MRVLVDSCVPQRIRHAITGHEVRSARYAGLEGLLDKDLLDAMEGRFDVLVTCDQSIGWQQNMAGRSVLVVLLRASSNRLPDLLPLVPELLSALKQMRPGQVLEIPR